MNFTFGIISDASPASVALIRSMIETIRALKVPEYEIIVVGDCFDLKADDVSVIHFDESIKRCWITRKKNIITETAKFENIVYCHDYIMFDPGWYAGFERFGEDFKACMTPMVKMSGERFRDWTMLPDTHTADIQLAIGLPENSDVMLPYEETSLSRLMYFSGAYWIAKKSIMKELPLDEARGHHDSEDLDWSYRFRAKYDFSINPFSKVTIAKDHPVIFRPFPVEHLARFKEAFKAFKPK